LQHVPAGLRRWLEVWCCAVAAGLAGFFTWRAAVLAYDSWRFDDRSYGLVSIPIWIPQAAMVLGLAVLTVALVDELVGVLRGQEPNYVKGEALLSPADEP
jgi:TRAP-type C4-dicarboxylate transport system permease small subunit